MSRNKSSSDLESRLRHRFSAMKRAGIQPPAAERRGPLILFE
jgi:hypothetical protein